MTAKGWIAAWSVMLVAAIALMLVHGGWVVGVGTPVSAIALFMIAGNAQVIAGGK